MGWYFSNMHIRKTAGLTEDKVQALLTEVLGAQGFLPKDSAEDADLSVSVCAAGEKWISLCSDGLEFYTEKSVTEICNPLSESLSTDVLIISCFDSDCLILNYINRKNNLDVFARTGRCPEIKRRSAPAKWKGIVDDLEKWKAVFKQSYTFAEEALDFIEPLLGLEPGQGAFCDEEIPDAFEGKVHTFYYALPETAAKPEPPVLTIQNWELKPCEVGEFQVISAINTGGRSKGLAVAFSGSYVEHEEIRFKDVQLEFHLDHPARSVIPLQLEKRQTITGEWIYFAEVPDFIIPEAVKKGLPPMKAMNEEFKRNFLLRFTPEGNNRKALDITLHFIPLKNIEAGQCAWRVWLYDGSKRAYLENHGEFFCLDPDDYDLDD